MPSSRQTRVIIVKAQVQGDREFRKLATQLGSINRNTETLSKSFGGLRNIFAAGIFGLGLQDLVRSVDQFQLLEDRIKVFTGNAEDAATVFDGLRQAARFTRTSIDGLAQSYNRIALATQELGLNQNQILATTIALQQSFRLSGATIAEATASTIQLAQGLSSGQLRGQELRSVLEQNAVFANILSKELGITRGQLIKFAESGRITNDRVLTALRDNFDSLNEDAKNLGTTFSQTITIALDAFRFKLGQLNKEFGLNSAFERGVLAAIDNVGVLAQTFVAFVASRALFSIITGVGGLTFALKNLATFFTGPNPIILGLTALIFTSQKLSENLRETFSPNDIGQRITKITQGIAAQQQILERASRQTEEGGFIGRFFGGGQVERSQGAIKSLQEELVKLQDLQKRGFETVPEGETLDQFVNRLRESMMKLNVNGATPITGIFGEVNREFQKGVINIDQYRQQIDGVRLEALNEKFKQGKITVDQYTDAFLKLNEQVNRLSLADQALAGLNAGFTDVLNGVGNLATQTRQAVGSTFGELESQVLNFVKTGKFAFQDFAQFVLDELSKVIIRLAIIRPLANAALGAFGGGIGPGISFGATGVGASVGATAANGAAFSGPIQAFANGGVVNGPTMFPMSAGRTGLMGEAGPEAIVPLERGPGGKLGINASGTSGVVVNVNNYTDNEVEVRETKSNTGERQLEVLVTRSVSKAIGEGRFDRQFNQTYGLQRRGT